MAAGPFATTINNMISSMDSAGMDRSGKTATAAVQQSSANLYELLRSRGFHEESETIRLCWEKMRMALDQAYTKALAKGI